MMSWDAGPGEPRPRLSIGVAAGLAAATLCAHLVFSGRYGIFRDELYYLACSEHLAFGYVDHPPFSILVLWAARALLGDGLWAIRLPAALSSAGAVFLTAVIARDLGGGRYAQALAALGVAIGPVYLVVGHFFSMNAIDVVLWVLASWLFLRAIAAEPARPSAQGEVRTGRAPATRERDVKLLRVAGDEALRHGWTWIALGVVLGMGLQNKISVLWLGGGLAAGLILTPARRWLATPWPWVTGALALVIFAPHIVWQVQHGWPTLEFMRNATERKMAPVSPVEFFLSQIFAQHPFTLPLWLAGLAYFVRAGRGGKGGEEIRALAFVFLVPLVVLVASGRARGNYLSPAFPVLFAGGGVLIESWLRMRWWPVRPAIVAALVAGGLLTAPIALPVLPVATLVAYSRALGVMPRAEEKVQMGPLPQYHADMFGWPEMAAKVAEVYDALPAEDRAKAAIYAPNYGRAGAIDFFGPRHGLPRALSGHNNYFLWGPRDYTGEVVILIGGDLDDHMISFREVQQVAATDCTYCMPYESTVPIYLARGLKAPLKEVWPSVKEFI